MVALTRKDVEQIARLARLDLSDAELERMQSELGSILAFFETLEALDTTGVEPMTHAVPMNLRLRADEVAPSLPVEVATGQAPDRTEGGFRVPKIVEGAS